MPQSKQQTYTFLIYAHSDKKTVRKLYRHITRHHIKAWLDEKELLPGQNWKYEIRQAILRSDVVIVCLSRQFNKQGGFRHEELQIALEKARSFPDGEIFIIPARMEKCDLPELLCPWQCVDLFEPDGFNKLLSVLKDFDYQCS
jgi:TIR domain-containing protein